MNAPSDTLGRVAKIVSVLLSVDIARVTPDANLYDLHADDLDVAEIVMECEAEFGVDIPDADADHVRTVAALAALIDRRMPVEAGRAA